MSTMAMPEPEPQYQRAATPEPECEPAPEAEPQYQQAAEDVVAEYFQAAVEDWQAVAAEPQYQQTAAAESRYEQVPEPEQQESHRSESSSTEHSAEPATAADGSGSSLGLSGGGGRVQGEGQSLSALMDELLRNDTGAPLADAGPASAQVAEAVASRGADQSFLAAVFWWLFTHSDAYKHVARRLRASRRARPIVVAHADGTRFDLLLLDPRRRRRLDAVQLEGDETYARFVSSSLPRERLNSLLRRSDLGDSLESETLLNSAQELAASSEFGVAIVNSRREIPTCALSPAVALQKADDTPVATLGSFLTDVDATAGGTCLATTANHAVGRRRSTLTVDGALLDVVRRHNASDSCLVRVNKSILDGRQQNGLKGPLRGITPNLYRPANFDGAASKTKRTKITSFDTAIVDPQPDEMCRVYTEADTARGDSGAALIDENDFIIGFAWRLSRYDSPVQYSSWVWAEQVYMAHNLFLDMALRRDVA